MVADLWEQREGGGDWNFRFARNLNDWELDTMERFLLKLQGQLVNREEEEARVVWKGDSKGRFSVGIPYSQLEPDYVIPFSLGIIWNSKIPSKVSFFAWEACWGKALTLD